MSDVPREHPSVPESMPVDEPVVAEARLMGRAVGVYLDEVMSQPFVTKSMGMRLVRDWQYFRFDMEPADDFDDDDEDE